MDEKLARMYRSLYLIRAEKLARIYPSDKIKSPVHLSIGQEAVAVGACEALRPDDVVFITYRSHAAYLAKGGDLKQMMAELYGKVTGNARGKGGSMHMIDATRGVMGASAVVGTTIANSIGYAYALKYRRQDNIVVSFFGDGGVDEGVWHESMNWAALKKLPIIFICENNFYAIHTHQTRRQNNPNIWERAQSYGMPAERIEGNDVLKIYKRVSDAVSRLRRGEDGPFFECLTYRWLEHVGPGDDYQLGYRSEDELAPWRESDQVPRIGAMLDDAGRQQIEADVEADIAAAIAFAEESPFPEAHELQLHVFKE